MANGKIIPSGVICTKSVYFSYTAAANGGRFNTNLKTLIDNDAPAGARVIGIVGIGSGSGGMVPLTFRYGNSDYSLDIRNITSASITAQGEVVYAYIL